MATKVKPSRVNITGTPQVGQVPVYVDESCFEWGDKQDALTAGPNITINCSTISGDFNYAEPTTAAATATKCVCIPEITQLCVGQRIVVKPTITATNCATNLQLNNFTAYPVRYNNAALTSTTDGYVWGANQLTEFVFDGSYWHVVSKSYDANTTYTMNYSVDAGKYKAGSGNYAISRYSLVMQKQDMTWEKIVATNQTYSTGTSHNVNTNGFILNQLRYYNTTTNLANGAIAAANVFYSKAASIDLRYSTNCGGVTNWGEGDYIYIVGTMGNDGLFYLDTTTRWTNKLPTTKDGKLYIRIGLCLAAGGYTCTLFDYRPIFYYDNGIKEYKVADNKQDTLVSGTNIKTINGCDLLGSGDLCIAGGVSSVNGQTGAVCLTIPTDNCELANGCGYTTCTGTVTATDLQCYVQCCDMSGYQLTCNMVCDLTGADNTHYPTAKAVADAIQCSGGGDMMKSTYDPCNCNDDAFDYCNFHNTPTIPTDNCQLANGCGYTTCTGTLSSCADIVSALGYTPYSDANPCGYTTCTGTLQACDIANLAQCCDIPTDNCQLANGCGYTTCTGTVSTCADVISALGYTPYNNTNPCGYTSCTGTLSTCSDITTALGYTPYSNANPCGYTTCTGTLVASDIACINGCCLTCGGDICIQGGTQLCYYSEGSCTAQICIHAHTITSTICNTTTSGIKLNFNDGICDTYLSVGNNGVEVQTETSGTYIFNDACTNGVAKLCDIPSVSGLVQESCIACVNGCCLTQGGNICISGGGADYSRCTKVISGGCLEIGLRTIVNPPTSDFTLTVPATIQEGEEYVIRTISCTSYCMCLGSCFTNPRNVNTCLSGNATDQYVFLAIGGELELQPLVACG